MRSIIALLFLASYVAADLHLKPIVNGLSGTGFCTTYWDCCKPSCSWSGNLPSGMWSPVNSCSIDGDTVIDSNAMSGCGDGPAYMCTNQQPWALNNTLSFGFAGGSFTGGTDYSKCCSCFLVTFIGANKQLVLQVTNTGSDALENQFDIGMPGGGVGINNGCKPQWNAPDDGWGNRYGGVQSIEGCNQLPTQLQHGCRWRFEFLPNVDFSNIAFEEVQCPQELTSISNCH